MNICIKHDFGEVEAYELGYGPIGQPLMNVLFYLIDGVMIDTAQQKMQKTCLEIIKDKNIQQVLLTHHHEDHSGNAAAVNRMKKIPVRAHPLTVEKLRNSFKIKSYQKLIWGPAETMDADDLPEEIESTKYKFIPVHVPGHSKDHTVYYVKEMGWLFSGDLFLGPKIKYFRADEKMYDTILSLKKTLDLDFDTLFCAHNPQMTGGKKLLKRKLDYLENFYGNVTACHEKGLDEKDILKKMGLKEELFVKIFTLGNVSLLNMIRSSLLK